MSVVTRFAPSPTGYLHIGGARTALFNWLFVRHHGGTCRLRIEDTDRKRSTPDAIRAIIDGLEWFGLDWDGPVVYQSERADAHAASAKRLLDEGKAYRCYCSPEELAEMRENARAAGSARLYDGRWRERDPSEAPEGIDPVVRIKMPLEGETVIEDAVQGQVRIANDQLDDFVLLRADGTPTYMLSVVVDDHDMGITHVIRGDDHLTNAFRQWNLYRALGWETPVFAHIPLIHGPDGKKLSKRHGALSVEAYRDMGYLPEALRNYLLRLGWAHGDDEIIPTERAIAWFDLEGVGRSPSRMDFAKLDSLNGVYLRDTDAPALTALITPRLEEAAGSALDPGMARRVTAGMDGLKERAKTLNELADAALFYVQRPVYPLAIAKAAKALQGDAPALIAGCLDALERQEPWDAAHLEAAMREHAENLNVGFGKIAQPIRSGLTGSNASPSLFEVMEILGRDECLARLRAVPGVA